MANVDWTSIGLGSLGFLGGLFGQSSANQQQSELLERQIEWQKEAMQNRYQWTVQDLKSAGINPIMAVSGLNAGNAGSVSAPQVGNLGAAASASAQQMAAVGNSANESFNRTMLTRSSANAQDAAAATSVAQALDLTLKGLSGYWELLGGKMSQETVASAGALALAEARLKLDWQDANVRWSEAMQRVEVMQTQVDEYQAKIKLLEEQAKTESTRRELMSAQAGLARAQKGLVKAQESLTMTEDQVYRLEKYRHELGLPELEFYSDLWKDPEFRKHKKVTEGPYYKEGKEIVNSVMHSPLLSLLYGPFGSTRVLSNAKNVRPSRPRQSSSGPRSDYSWFNGSSAKPELPPALKEW